MSLEKIGGTYFCPYCETEQDGADIHVCPNEPCANKRAKAIGVEVSLARCPKCGHKAIEPKSSSCMNCEYCPPTNALLDEVMGKIVDGHVGVAIRYEFIRAIIGAAFARIFSAEQT